MPYVDLCNNQIYFNEKKTKVSIKNGTYYIPSNIKQARYK